LATAGMPGSAPSHGVRNRADPGPTATGITRVRPGAGIAAVGNPRQCADTLQQFIDAGCHSVCLSGYLHDEEAERFGRLIRPILAETNRGRLAA
jgi:alkanesulfonate monooxygenase